MPLRQTQLLLRPQPFGGLLQTFVAPPQTHAHLHVVGFSAAPVGQFATQALLQQVNPAGQVSGTQVLPEQTWHTPHWMGWQALPTHSLHSPQSTG